MTKHKHTPGPWLIEGVVQNTGSISVCAGWMGICDVVNGVSIFEALTGEAPRTQMASAQLIATAPNLLAAAQLRKYETLHRAKGTADNLAKAKVNAELASRFEQAIAQATT